MLNSSFHPSLALQTVTGLRRIPTQRFTFCKLFHNCSCSLKKRTGTEPARRPSASAMDGSKRGTIGGSWPNKFIWHPVRVPLPAPPAQLQLDQDGFRRESAHHFSMPAHGTEEINVWHYPQTLIKSLRPEPCWPSGASAALHWWHKGLFNKLK